MKPNTTHIINVVIRPFEDKNIIFNLFKFPHMNLYPEDRFDLN